MIDIRFEPQSNRAAAYEGDQKIGEGTFSPSPNIWILDHTQVDPAYQGQGIARRLVDEIVRQARAKKVKIMPLCPYALRLFESNQEYGDIWQKQDQ